MSGLVELRALAEAATSEPWTYLGSSTSKEDAGHRPGSTALYCDLELGRRLEVTDQRFGRHALDDAAYIAAVSPDVVLGLLDRLAASEAEVRDLLDVLDEVEALRAKVTAVEAVCDIVDGTGALHRDVRAKLEAAAAKVAETLTPEMVSRVEAAWQTQVIGDGPGVPLRGLVTLTDAHPSASEAPQSAQDVAEAPESHHDRDEGWEAKK